MEGTKKRTAVLLLSSAILVAAGLVAIGSGFSAALATTTMTTPSVPPVNLKTDNGSVDVVVDWSPKEIQQGQAAEFSINFKDPSSGALLEHVNYSLEVKDAGGNTIESLTDQHVHAGEAVQMITFDNTGDFQLTITVLGTGLEMPFDTSHSGTAATSVMVASS
ncbi:hypothetical protein [Nitrososphaera viennensis]|mgnify:CR=1 FL=1|nr:hypothetical protein [Nitrososphaera viennensis]UVS69942.1 hypothetical protein NWT39_03930 [Nitrososphaera viennensis]